MYIKFTIKPTRKPGSRNAESVILSKIKTNFTYEGELARGEEQQRKFSRKDPVPALPKPDVGRQVCPGSA